MTEKDLLADCLRRLNQTGVPYMLTGSMASNYWGIPLSAIAPQERRRMPDPRSAKSVTPAGIVGEWPTYNSASPVGQAFPCPP